MEAKTAEQTAQLNKMLAEKMGLSKEAKAEVDHLSSERMALDKREAAVKQREADLRAIEFEQQQAFNARMLELENKSQEIGELQKRVTQELASKGAKIDAEANRVREAKDQAAAAREKIAQEAVELATERDALVQEVSALSTENEKLRKQLLAANQAAAESNVVKMEPVKQAAAEVAPQPIRQSVSITEEIPQEPPTAQQSSDDRALAYLVETSRKLTDEFNVMRGKQDVIAGMIERIYGQGV